MSDIMNMYKCPACGENGAVNSIMPLMDNIRYDSVSCKCGAAWRVYYKISDPKTEIMYIPEEQSAADNNNSDGDKMEN